MTEQTNLTRLMQISTALGRQCSLPNVLRTLLDGIQTFNLSRVRLYSVSMEQKILIGWTKSGREADFIGRVFFVSKDPYVSAVLAEPLPQIFQRRPGDPISIEHDILNAAVAEWLLMPLVWQGNVIALISADNLPDGPALDRTLLDHLAILANQAAATIHHTRLLPQLEETNQKYKIQRRRVRKLQEVSRAIHELIDPSEIFRAACEAAVNLFEIDHSGLVLFEPDYRRGRVMGEFPDMGAVHTTIPVDGVPLEEKLLTTEAPIYLSDTWTADSLGPVQQIFQRIGIRSIVIVPVISQGRVIGSLSLDAIDRTREFTQDEIELAQAFAAQIAPILQTVQQNGAEQKALSQLMTMHKISNYIQAADDLDKMLHVVLTSITAGFGQGFNRAALFLLDPKREALVGRLGIGHFEPAAAYEDWGRIQREGLNNFDVYLQLLEQDAFHLTPVGERIDKLRLNFDPHDRDLFTRVIQTGRHHLVREDELAQLPALFQETFEPSRPMIIVPLLAQEQAIGLLVADNKFTQAPITHDLVDSLVTVVNTAAVVIEKARLFAEMKLAREKLRAFYVASNTLISSPNPQKMLDDIVEQLRKAAGASGVSMLIIDPDGRVQNIITAGSDEAMPLTELIRPDGLSMAVMRSGQPTAFEDADRQPERVNPAVFQRNIVAALCLPLSLEGKRFGVMWIHYDRPHHFPEFEVDALKLFVNQAAIAYDHARQLDRLETIRQAAAALASVSGLSNTLDQIVQSATKVLGADSTAIFTYHVVKDRLYFQDRTSDNIPIEHKPSFQKAEPSRGKVVDTVLAERWVGVEDLNQPDRYPFAGRTSRRLLKQINVVSFQAVALAVGDEELGILYANYSRPRHFSEEEKQIARTFANHASLALKKAKLLDQVSRGRNAAKVMAEVTTLENIDDTLDSIARGTKEALNCDAVALYVYNQDKDQFEAEPTLAGAAYPERVHGQAMVQRDSVVFAMLRQDKIYITNDTAADPYFSQTRFAREEGILTCAAIPLQVGGRRVGVMFLNYRTEYHFSEDEQFNMALFANQAAVAIRNWQLYTQQVRQVSVLSSLYGASQALTASLDPDEILLSIAEQAWNLTGRSGKHSQFSLLALLDGTKLTFRVAYPPEHLARLQHDAWTMDLNNPQKLGISGQAIKTGQAQLIGNVLEVPHYVQYDLDSRSELAVPIKVGDEVIGVINVEHAEYEAFDQEDLQALESLAALAGAAIQNAYLFERSQRQVQLLGAAAHVAHGASAMLEIDELLEETARLIADVFGFYHTGIFLRDPSGNYAVLQATAPHNNHDMCRKGYQLKVGEQGIVGHVIQTGEHYLAPNINDDPYHLRNPNLPETRSEMVFPLVAHGQIIGAVDLQSDQEVHLLPEEVTTLQTLAGQLANAISNAQLYQQVTDNLVELTQTKIQLDMRTAVAWMGMISSVRRHSIDNHAVTILDELAMLAELLPPESLTEPVRQKLEAIRLMATKIRSKPITPPALTEERVESVAINSLLQDRLTQLLESVPQRHEGVQREFIFHLEDCRCVRASVEWLQRIFDVLIDNALEAMRDVEVRRLTITTRQSSSLVEIAISDTGTGIPDAIRPSILVSQVIKEGRSRGLGMGLLMAQMIVQNYQGEIKLAATGSEGTTFVVQLPLEL